MAVPVIRQEYVQLARSLPRPLLSFFQKFPQYTSSSTQKPTTATDTSISTASNTSSEDANANSPTQILSTNPTSPQTLPSTFDAIRAAANPFLPFKNPLSGHWHPPAYSLRAQSSLVRMAAEHHVLDLLPPSPKHPATALEKRVEHGLRVKGTGRDQRVKGKMWERTLKGRLDERRKAMEGMGELIRSWKQKGHGRGWKKYPK